MGVHHAWGRTYKDLFQRFHTMLGKQAALPERLRLPGTLDRGRGREGAGLQVQARHRELRRRPSSSRRCKERVRRFAAHPDRAVDPARLLDGLGQLLLHELGREQLHDLGASSRSAAQNGWIYKGHDVMPWCPRCGTGISEHEIVTEGYQEITHTVHLRLELPAASTRRTRASRLLVWTTTPWTLPANVAAAVHPDLTYVQGAAGRRRLLRLEGRASRRPSAASTRSLGEVKGSELVGADLSRPVRRAAGAGRRRRTASSPGTTSATKRAPASSTSRRAAATRTSRCRRRTASPSSRRSTRTAPTVGDGFELGRSTGQLRRRRAARWSFDSLREKGLLYRVQDYTHRYPTCWRCGTELVFRLVDEWFISMDGEVAGTPMTRDRSSRRRADPLDPRVRRGARARLAAQHGRLDDLEEALLRPGAADLRVPGLRHLRGHRLRGGAGASARSRAGSEFEGHTPAPALDRRGQDRLPASAARRSSASRTSATPGSTPASCRSRR